MKTLLRLSKLIAPLIPVMTLAVIFGTAGFFCAISIPALGVAALFKSLPFKFLILLGVARGVLHYAEQYCNHFIAFTLLARIRNVVFAKLRELGPAKLEGKQKGNLISLLTSDIELLELFYAHTVSPVCIAILVSAGVISVLAQFHYSLAILAAFFYIIVGICIPALVQKFSLKTGAAHRAQFAEMNAFLLDTLRGLMQSILFKNGEKKLAFIKSKTDDMAENQKKMALQGGWTAVLIDGVIILADIAMLFLTLALLRSGAIDFAAACISVALLVSSFGPVVAVARLGSSLSQTVAAGKRVLSLLDEKPVVSQVQNESDVKEFSGAELDSVHFSYDGNEKILSDISLAFKKGGIIGLQGKSGSGKSTILKLLMHFWHADSGSVKISNLPIEKINTSSLRSLESYVTQETVLFHDTIENNIRLARLDATHEEIVEACRRASVHDFIASLPNGYETQVAELGENFSGGERQRLGLARSFLHGGEFLLLDEPTSNLDSYNEKIILESVKQEAAKKTVVLVSHRESTLSVAEKIYKIETGRMS